MRCDGRHALNPSWDLSYQMIREEVKRNDDDRHHPP